jgi:hypothetical protein
MDDIKKYLNDKQWNDYTKYVQLREQAFREKWHHWQRIAMFREGMVYDHEKFHDAAVKASQGNFNLEDFNLKWILSVDNNVEVKHCIPFQHPFDLDAPMPVCHPSGNFLKELMNGGVHPRIEDFHEQQILMIDENGDGVIASKLDAAGVRSDMENFKSEYVIQNSACHLNAGGPMSYEEAIEFVLLKDVPKQVWHEDYTKHHNRPQFYIAEKHLFMDRTHRNAWDLGLVEEAR